MHDPDTDQVQHQVTLVHFPGKFQGGLENETRRTIKLIVRICLRVFVLLVLSNEFNVPASGRRGATLQISTEVTAIKSVCLLTRGHILLLQNKAVTTSSNLLINICNMVSSVGTALNWKSFMVLFLAFAGEFLVPLLDKIIILGLSAGEQVEVKPMLSSNVHKNMSNTKSSETKT